MMKFSLETLSPKQFGSLKTYENKHLIKFRFAFKLYANGQQEMRVYQIVSSRVKKIVRNNFWYFQGILIIEDR